MSQTKPLFQVGDQVIHWAYGPGEIVRIDEKEISGQTAQYYVVRTRDLTMWVTADETAGSSLRFHTSPDEFQGLMEILSSEGEPLSEDRFERKNQLMDRLKDHKIESVCRVVRDLAHYQRTRKMNDSDHAILNRSKGFLLNEWSLAFSIPATQAEKELSDVLNQGA